MKPIFFFYKMREVKSFLKIMSGKLTGNNERRIKGIDEALSNMKDEQKVYLDERKKRPARSGAGESGRLSDLVDLEKQNAFFGNSGLTCTFPNKDY